MRMIIQPHEPVFTIGRAPFVAAAIHVRNHVRILKQREKARRRKALLERLSALRGVLPRFFAARQTLVTSGSPATANV
jgi:hypothetical protein